MKWIIIILGILLLLFIMRKPSNHAETAESETLAPDPEDESSYPEQRAQKENSHPLLSDIIRDAEARKPVSTHSSESDPQRIREKDRTPPPPNRERQ